MSAYHHEPEEDSIRKLGQQLNCGPYIDTILQAMVDKIHTLEKEVEAMQERLDYPNWRDRR